MMHIESVLDTHPHHTVPAFFSALAPPPAKAASSLFLTYSPAVISSKYLDGLSSETQVSIGFPRFEKKDTPTLAIGDETRHEKKEVTHD